MPSRKQKKKKKKKQKQKQKKRNQQKAAAISDSAGSTTTEQAAVVDPSTSASLVNPAAHQPMPRTMPPAVLGQVTQQAVQRAAILMRPAAADSSAPTPSEAERAAAATAALRLDMTDASLSKNELKKRIRRAEKARGVSDDDRHAEHIQSSLDQSAV